MWGVCGGETHTVRLVCHVGCVWGRNTHSQAWGVCRGMLTFYSGLNLWHKMFQDYWVMYDPYGVNALVVF